MVRSCLALLFTALILAAGGGCQRAPTQVAPAEPPALPVSHPVQREVTNYVDFTGRTEAVEAVDIRPRVTGYLVRVPTPFKEGSDVKKGDLLFEIDPRPYQAQLDQAQGQVALNEASLKLARTTYERDRAIANSVAGGVSRQQLDQDLAAVDEAAARLKAAQASTEVYKLNLEFSKVTSPIDGRVSRYYLTPGNLVNQDQTLLTTVVSLDPINVYFDVDEVTVLRIRRARNAGLIKPAPDNQFPVLMGLQGEDGFPHAGTVNFVNNQVNPATGSITVRGVFQNPLPEGGIRLLSPGMFVRVRLPIGQPHPALLVIDRAIGSEQGLKFVYVLDAENKLQPRRVTTGPLQEDGLRVITEGLKADDWLLVGGLPQVRARLQIQPERVTMPTLGQAPSAETQNPKNEIPNKSQSQNSKS
jgi:multidrug efflux system membrane fusion protein